MSSNTVMKAMIGFYIAIFFLYLFGPLAVMSVTAFNTPNYPTAYPFEGFTLGWFVKLWNHRAMMEGLWNSVIIGLGVVAVSVPVGLAAIPGSCRCWERVVSVVPVGRAMPGSVAVTEVSVALADVPESSTVAAVPVVRVAPAAMTAMVVTVVPVAPRVRSQWWARAVPVVPVATAATTATVAPVVQAAIRV